MLQPSTADVLVGNILLDSIGDNAKKKIAKQRIDFISGNVASYSRSLSNPKTLELIADTNRLASCLSVIAAAKEKEKDAAKQKKDDDVKAKEAKKANEQAAFQSKKGEVYDNLVEDISKGLDHIGGLPKATLLQLLKFYFEDKTPNQSKMKRNELLALVTRLHETFECGEGEGTRLEARDQTKQTAVDEVIDELQAESNKDDDDKQQAGDVANIERLILYLNLCEPSTNSTLMKSVR